MVRVVVIAGTHSGVGKTSLSVGLMLAFRQRGLTVQPFKVGPDFLDPLHHVAACGRESINLDGWMLNKQQVLDSFHRHTTDADVAVVEGVMGLYDSRDGASDDGSTAQIAKWLGAPVVLVVDCWAMARSAAALVKGYSEFDPDLNLCGVLLNKVGSTGHGVWLAEALTAAWQQQRLQKQIKVMGCIPKDDSVSVTERYLGLTMPHEQDSTKQQQGSRAATGSALVANAQSAPPFPDYLSRLAQHVSTHVDLDQLLKVAASIDPSGTATGCNQQEQLVQQQQHQHQQQLSVSNARHALPLLKTPGRPHRCRIAVARDEAFCFYYQDNFALLSAAGAELVPFSPLRSPHLPAHIQGIYFGGGYPERYAQQLSSNSSMLTEVRQWASAGGVVYAECGGLMYLCQGFPPSAAVQQVAASSTDNSCSSAGNDDSKGNSSNSGGSSSSCGLIPLVGLLPIKAQMGGMKMGYVEVEVLQGNPLFPPGAQVRGQVYHFSEVVPFEPSSRSSSVQNGDGCASFGSTAYGAAPEAGASPKVSSSISQPRCGEAGNRVGTDSCSVSQPAAAVQHTYRLQQVLPGAQPTLEGYAVGNALASYVHLHWGGCPQLAAALVDKCCSSSSSSSSNSSSDSSGSRAGTAGDVQGRASQAATPAGASSAARSHTNSGSNEASTVTGTACGSSSSCYCVAAGAPFVTSSSNSKIVSLLPSGTEIVYALGLQERLVGVSGFCDWPLEARSRPCAVRSLIDVDSMSSDEIEAAMQTFKAAGQSPFQIDVSLLAREQPGLVLTQDACQTCDADCSLVCKAMQLASLSADKTLVLILHPRTLAEVLDSIMTIGRAAGAVDRAQQLVEQLQGRLQAVAAVVHTQCPAAVAETIARASTAVVGSQASNSRKFPASSFCDQHTTTQPCRTAAAAADAQDPGAVAVSVQQQHQQEEEDSGQCSEAEWQRAPRVLSLEGLNPLVLGGQWLPDVKLAAGAVDASGQQPGDPPTRITWEQVLSYAPDVLLLCPCSRSTAAAMPDVTHLTQQPGFMTLPAVQLGRVYVIDHSYFSRPGPRLVDGIELLSRLLWGVAAGSGGDDGHYVHVHESESAGVCCGCTCDGDGGDVQHAVLRMWCSAGGRVEWLPV